MVALLCFSVYLASAPPEIVLDPSTSSVTSLTSPYSGRAYAGQGGVAEGGILLPGHAAPMDPGHVTWVVVADGDDAVIQGSASSAAAGVKGIALAIRGIPDDLDVILPACTGIVLTHESAPPAYRAPWPLQWEAGLVILQGDGEGFAVMADGDPIRFKEIEIVRRDGCWDVVLESHNDAPWDALTGHTTLPWRIVCYQGDWRVPADRYRAHLDAYHDLSAARAGEPEWIDDIRLCVTMSAEPSLLEPLAARCDPTQTLLYIPTWRQDPYDRNYPDYTPATGFAAFIQRAHDLGFRVMPHFNYFGVDPLHPLYEEFGAHHLLDPETGAPMWWIWDRVEPIIKFAYIHPGYKRWQAELVDRMATAWEELRFDAVHIDQTLVIPNHAGGLVDGVNAPQGALELHRALREALPQVALSGEGLNEVSFVYEAFAQRHVQSYNHTDSEWDREWLDRAHPISAYLFTPHTKHYGYLGMAPPADGQAYSAWRQAYRRQNVIPTIVGPTASALEEPAGFWQLAFDEARAWQEGRFEADTSGPWPDSLCYAYRASDGRRAEYLDDDGTVFRVGDETVYRVVAGVDRVDLPGTIDGWRYYSEEALLGLDPDRWYIYKDTPRNMALLHVEAAPLDAGARVNTPGSAYTRVSLSDEGRIVADLGRDLPAARCALVLEGEPRTWQQGGLGGPEALGAMIARGARGLHFHPSWQAGPEGRAAAGTALARYEFTLPEADRLTFRARAHLRPGAEGKSDGAEFTVRATSQENPTEPLAVSAIARTEEGELLALDLTPLAGRAISLDVSCGPGPDGDPSFDWGALSDPVIDRERRGLAPITLAGELPQNPVGTDLAAEYDGRAEVLMPFPGAIYFTDDAPTSIALPTDLSGLSWRLSCRDVRGLDQPMGQYAGLTVAPAEIDGVAMPGMTTHPPDGGEISLQALVTLPAQPSRFVADVGLRDGSLSDGVTFEVWVGGVRQGSLHMEPGPRQVLEADLSAYADQTVVIELVVDSEGSYYCDWAHWGRPRLEPQGP